MTFENQLLQNPHDQQARLFEHHKTTRLQSTGIFHFPGSAGLTIDATQWNLASYLSTKV